MSREDLYRIAGPPQYDPSRQAHVKELARLLKQRAKDKISVEESITTAAQFLANFDYKFRRERVGIERKLPISL